MDPRDHDPSYRLVCPVERFEKDIDGKVTTISGQTHHIIPSSYIISVGDEDENSNQLHSLRYIEGDYKTTDCWVCEEQILRETYYLCSYCKVYYHTECVRTPPEFHSSDHPKHPLQLVRPPRSFRQDQKQCCSCRRVVKKVFYYCSICEFSLHPICAGKPTSLSIDNPKRHKHTLHYFPRRMSALVCDVCGLKDINDYLYICLICDFVVHKRCVDLPMLPYVIKISRHNHRLAFTCNLPCKDAIIDCGVCHTTIDGNYGEYSCTKERCVYAVHSKCAMQPGVYGGAQLESKTEITYDYYTKTFEEKGDGIIQHYTHNHQLRFEKKTSTHDESRHCQACKLSFYVDDNVYRCLQCDDFILHEPCAYLPRMKQFMLHVHPLILEVVRFRAEWFECRKCGRYSCGFAYACVLRRGFCYNYWVLDTLCASICEPFEYHSHPHPLFITCGEDETKICSICYSSSRQPLNCLKCDFVLCFRCATLPHKAKYAHDEHLLVFSYEEDANDDEIYDCETCEEDINPKNGFYVCKKCGVTLHIDCLLGKDPYMKHGQVLTYFYEETVHILGNTCSTRSICKTCGKRCLYKIKIVSSRKGGPFCSVDCYHKIYYKLEAST